jgi:hypothetical protein
MDAVHLCHAFQFNGLLQRRSASSVVRVCQRLPRPRLRPSSVLAMMLVEKYANHQPLNRQSEQYDVAIKWVALRTGSSC